MEIQKMLEIGVIEKADSPYSAPIVLVRKKDGTHRFCVDYRQLNKHVIFSAEPLPELERLFAQLSKAKYFSKLDMSKGYWQLPVCQADKKKLAFSTPEGQFQWNVMPFGILTAPATFTKMMRLLIEPMQETTIHNFMDDVLIATETFTEHMRVLEKLIVRLQECNLTARPSKCLIAFQRLEYLGHTVGHGLLWPDAAKVQKLSEMSRPITKTNVKSFLGLAGYYRKFIPDFSKVAKPLTDLTKKGQPSTVHWDPKCEIAFETLKDSLAKQPVLHLPDLNKEFILRTDASNVGLGAMLMQTFEGDIHPVAYASRCLNKAECNYSTSEKECLAIIWGIQKFQAYLYGKKFTIQTDHQPLAYISNSNRSNGRLTRWSLFLQQYRYQIQVIKGVDNVGADFLSRVIGNED